MARKQFSANFKVQVALDAIKNELTIAELAQKHGVHPSQIKEWKNVLEKESEGLFARKTGKNNNQSDTSKYVEALERKAGQQAVEIDFLKKGLSTYRGPQG